MAFLEGSTVLLEISKVSVFAMNMPFSPISLFPDIYRKGQHRWNVHKQGRNGFSGMMRRPVIYRNNTAVTVLTTACAVITRRRCTLEGERRQQTDVSGRRRSIQENVPKKTEAEHSANAMFRDTAQHLTQDPKSDCCDAVAWASTLGSFDTVL